MNVLLIGGTGTISSAVADRLLSLGNSVSMLNRGNHPIPEGAELLQGDIHDEEAVKGLIASRHFDSVCEFMGFLPEEAERDIRLFEGKTDQLIYISSASAYQKPIHTLPITEETPLENPFWAYSRNKAASEAVYFEAYEKSHFPVTVVRPSHTYNEMRIPTAFHGTKGPWQILERMIKGKPVIVPGDGTSLWTATFNTDFAVGFCGLVGNPKALGEAFHITSDEVLSWDEIHRVIGKALNTEPRLVHIPSELLAADDEKGMDLCGQLLGDKANSVLFDNRKIKSYVPEFDCKVRMADGIARAAVWMKEHPEVQIPDPEFDAWCDREISRRHA